MRCQFAANHTRQIANNNRADNTYHPGNKSNTYCLSKAAAFPSANSRYWQPVVENHRVQKANHKLPISNRVILVFLTGMHFSVLKPLIYYSSLPILVSFAKRKNAPFTTTLTPTGTSFSNVISL